MADWQKHCFNYVFTPLASIILILLFPPYILIKLLLFIKRSIYPENVVGKVVLITGASSGIGEHMAYAYARRGARLALAARRVEKLRKVADKARALGSSDVLLVATDVSKSEDCERMVSETINHFKQLDHLVNNAGIAELERLADITDYSKYVATMNINFWGSVYSTKAALPHLRKSKGKIIAIASCGVWCSVETMCFYNASKAAMITFFETLMTEEEEIGIMIVTPGIIHSEMTQGDKLEKANMHLWPRASTEESTEAMVKSACRGDRYSVEPYWVVVGHYFHALMPESTMDEPFYQNSFPLSQYYYQLIRINVILVLITLLYPSFIKCVYLLQYMSSTLWRYTNGIIPFLGGVVEHLQSS